MNQLLEITARDLKRALTGLAKVISRKATLPALGCVHIATQNNKATLTGTDLDTWLQVVMEAQTRQSKKDADAFLVPLSDLREAVKRCRPTNLLRLQPETDGRVSITRPVGGIDTKETFDSAAVADFPAVPTVKAPALELDSARKHHLIHAWEASSNDETRYVLNGAYLDVSDRKSHFIVGTDGKHLYSGNGANLPIKQSVILPRRKIFEWNMIRDSEPWTLTIDRKDDGTGTARFAGDGDSDSDRWAVTTKLIEGNYPNWRQVIPGKGDFGTTIEVPAEHLAALAETALKMPGAKRPCQPVGLQVKNRHLALIGSNGEGGPFTEVPVPDAEVTGAAVTAFINRKYFVRALHTGLNRVQVIDALSPVQFVAEGCRMIVMPVRVVAATAPHSRTKPQPQPETKERKPNTMPRPRTTTRTNSNGSNGNGATHPAAEGASAMDTAIKQMGEVKDLLKEAAAGLNGIALTLKQAKSDQKSTLREIKSVRSTIRSLQKVEL